MSLSDDLDDRGFLMTFRMLQAFLSLKGWRLSGTKF